MGTLRAIYTIDISPLSEAALRVKLADRIAKIRREYAQKQLTDDQRIALAGGNLDQAIAMGNRRV